MKRVVTLVLLFGITATVLYFFFKQPKNSSPISALTSPLPVSAAPASVAQTQNPAAVSKLPAGAPAAANAPVSAAAGAAMMPAATTPAVPLSDTPNYTNVPPEIVLQKVAHAIHDYASMFGSNPVGTNPEITAALNGNNPRQANFINPEDGMRVSSNGELIDPWGTPLFFHQLSGSLTEIRSAGPDRKMWTSDDLVAR